MTQVTPGTTLPVLPQVPNFALLIDQLLQVLPTAQKAVPAPQQDLSTPSVEDVPVSNEDPSVSAPDQTVTAARGENQPDGEETQEASSDESSTNEVRDLSRETEKTQEDSPSQAVDPKAPPVEEELPDEESDHDPSEPVAVDVDVMKLLSQQGLPIAPDTIVQQAVIATAPATTGENLNLAQSETNPAPPMTPTMKTSGEPTPVTPSVEQPTTIPVVQTSEAANPETQAVTPTEIPSPVIMAGVSTASKAQAATPVVNHDSENPQESPLPTGLSKPAVMKSEGAAQSAGSQVSSGTPGDVQTPMSDPQAGPRPASDSGPAKPTPVGSAPAPGELPSVTVYKRPSAQESTEASPQLQKDLTDLVRMVTSQEPSPSVSVRVETQGVSAAPAMAVPVNPAVSAGSPAAAQAEAITASPIAEAEGTDVPRSFVSAARAGKSAFAGSNQQAPSTEYIDRIVKAARLTEARGQTRIKIVLNPPNLGNLRVDLAVKNNVLRATFQTDTTAAKELILSNLHQLKESLSEQGIRLEEFHILAQQSGDQTQSQEGQLSRESRESRGDRSSFMPEESMEFDESEPRRATPSGRLQLIDVLA